MNTDDLHTLFRLIADEIRSGLDGLDNWGLSGGHPGQYHHDVIADTIAIPLLLDAGLGVISEESKSQGLDRPVVAIIDPIDGSTNASLGIPWFSTSICALDSEGLLVALVCNQATGVTYMAERGSGAEKDGMPVQPSTTKTVDDAVLVFNGLPTEYLGWKQYRTLGSAALDLCGVADGSFDGFIDFSSGLSAWDYAGAALICNEAGVKITDHVGGLLRMPYHFSDSSSHVQLVAAGTDSLHELLVSKSEV
ncbi:MAG: inositol monophosphatase [Acidimicrobiales bacterium]|nr:inositol monophosphatase [Acidimicrobiales bacterium]MDG1845846.1 inositol monophosphatase [Acidimicrobiales bacterium]